MSSNFFFKNLTVYGIMCIVQPGRPQLTTWRMRIVCWIPKATNTYSECIIPIDFPLQQWLHERASMLRYTCIACLVWVTWRQYCMLAVSVQSNGRTVTGKETETQPVIIFLISYTPKWTSTRHVCRKERKKETEMIDSCNLFYISYGIVITHCRREEVSVSCPLSFLNAFRLTSHASSSVSTLQATRKKSSFNSSRWRKVFFHVAKRPMSSLSLSISLSPGLLYSRVRSLFFVLAEMRCLVGGTRRPTLTASNPVRPFSDPRQNKKPATSKTVSINNNIAFSFRIIFIRVYLEKILVSVWTNTSQDPWLWRLDQIFSNILIIL